MPPTFILIFGVLITLIIVITILIVGVGEARDTDHARDEDLASWEKPLAEEHREEKKEDL